MSAKEEKQRGWRWKKAKYLDFEFWHEELKSLQISSNNIIKDLSKVKKDKNDEKLEKLR